MDDNEKQCCGNCKYAAYSRENGYVCENMNSDYASDYVEHDHGCEEWSFLIRYIAVVYFGFMVVVSFLNIVLGERPCDRIMSIINFCTSIVAIYFITH